MRHEAKTFYTCDWCGGRTDEEEPHYRYSAGWRHWDGEDFCPSCAAARTSAIATARDQRRKNGVQQTPAEQGRSNG